MSINYTSRLNLGQPTYLHEDAGGGAETAVDAVNANFTIIDNLIVNIVVHDGDIVTFDGEMVITIL